MDDLSISIIIPAYNVESYLRAALDSIKMQSQLPDEVILIDDGSTDRTLEVAKSYRFPVPYKVVSIENRGQGHARNLGVSLASSEYVYFFDSDDLLVDTFIASMKELLSKENRPDIVLFSGESFNDDQYKGSRWVDYSRGFSGSFDTRCEFLDAAYSNGGLFCSPCLYISKRSLWLVRGVKFKEDYFEDEAVFFPLLFSCERFVVTDEVFFWRRNRNGSTMTVRPNSKHVRGALNCINTSLEIFRAEGLSAREKWHLRKRIERHCARYWRVGSGSGEKVSLRKIIEVILVSKSFIVALVSVTYLAKVNDLKLVTKLKELLRAYKA